MSTTVKTCYLGLPGYEHDVFISYTHLDNEPELEDEDEGWIDNFHYAFSKRLKKTLGAKELDVWIDEKIHGNDEFDDLLLKTLAKVGILVSIISPAYLESEWCLRELVTFVENTAASPHAKRRIFPVIKEFVEYGQRPPSIQRKTAYEFVREAKSGEYHTPINPRTGAHKDPEFFAKLYELAADVGRLLKELHGDDAGATGQDNEPKRETATVFLAATAPDMASARTDLLRNCRDRQYGVLPEDTGIEDEAGGLPHANLSLHMLGSDYAVEVGATVTSLIAEVTAHPERSIEILEGSIESLKTHVFRDRLEQSAAADPSSYDGGHVIWIPQDIPEPDARQAKLIATVRGEVGSDIPTPPPSEAPPGDSNGSPVAETDAPASPAGATPAAPAPAGGSTARSVYLIYDQTDLDDPEAQEALGAILDRLDEAKVIVEQPAFGQPGDQHTSDEAARKEQEELLTLHRRRLRECDGFLLFYGTGDDLWFQSNLDQLRKLTGLGRPEAVRAVYLAPPLSGAKKLFRSPDLIVIKDAAAITSFLEALPQGVTA